MWCVDNVRPTQTVVLAGEEPVSRCLICAMYIATHILCAKVLTQMLSCYCCIFRCAAVIAVREWRTDQEGYHLRSADSSAPYLLAAACANGSVRLYDTRTATGVVRSFAEHSRAATCSDGVFGDTGGLVCQSVCDACCSVCSHCQLYGYCHDRRFTVGL